MFIVFAVRAGAEEGRFYNPEKEDGIYKAGKKKGRHVGPMPASMPARIKYHLLKNPQVGGTPIMENAPTRNAKKVSGILRGRPWKIDVAALPNPVVRPSRLEHAGPDKVLAEVKA